MTLFKEFKEFVGSGSAIDLAVGIVIGSAITTILTSFVNELVVPLTGLLGKADFSNMYWVIKGAVPEGLPLDEARKLAGAVVLGYGQFLTVLLNTLVLAFAVFILIRFINRLKRQEAPVEEPAVVVEAAPSQESLLAEIRDILKSKAL